MLVVHKPGLLTTVQDLGRRGHQAYGVPESGPLDAFAFLAGNRLVGNIDSAPSLECLLSGPTLFATRDVVVAITGGDFRPQVNGIQVASWSSLLLKEGDQLSFAGRVTGARMYIAVAGGIASDLWLGSRSTYLLVGRGGYRGRRLKQGDRLESALLPQREFIPRTLQSRFHPTYSTSVTLAAMAGPHFPRLTAASKRVVFGGEYQVGTDIDRMGYRLEGPPLKTTGTELLSFGLPCGTVQILHSGRPVILMADHQTTGGYPAALVVARASIAAVAQLLPANALTFVEVTRREALDRWSRLMEALGAIG